MEVETKYTFVPIAKKNHVGINDKLSQQLLSKWGIWGNFVIQKFSFNEHFQPCDKNHIAEAFFKDSNVAKELLTKQGKCWARQGSESISIVTLTREHREPGLTDWNVTLWIFRVTQSKKNGIVASTIEIKPVPCRVSNMSFFDKLKDHENGIIHRSGTICKRYDTEVESLLVSDNLRGMLLDDECPEYNLYANDEREEFIFRIFQMLVLGGTLCQYEDILDPYLDVTKVIYKDLIRVQKNKDSDLSISTVVLRVVAKNSRGEAYFPCEPSHVQNVGFLLVDGATREITTFLHQFGEYCLSE